MRRKEAQASPWTWSASSASEDVAAFDYRRLPEASEYMKAL
jgi:hypothetical protein